MATCSSILAWRMPWTEEPGRLQSIGLQRVEGFPGSSTGKESACNEEILVSLLGQEGLLENGVLTLVFLGFPGGSAGKESACDVGDLGSILGLGRSPGEGNDSPLQYLAWRIPCPEEPGRLQSMGLQKVRYD